MKIKLGEPIVVAQNPKVYPEDQIPWGEYQFPQMAYTEDGKIHISYAVCEDIANDCGVPREHAISADGGKTWTRVENDEDFTSGLFLPDKSAVRCYNFREAIKMDCPPESFQIPKEPDGELYFWKRHEKVYYANRFSDNSWSMEKKEPNGKWHKVLWDVTLPDNFLRYTECGVIPQNDLIRVKLAPDGKLWGLTYPFFMSEYYKRPVFQPVFMVSDDNGESFEFRSTIVYEPSPDADAYHAVRDGFTEPNIAFLPNGDIICLLRTQDGHANGPTYITRSTDNGYTWEKPEIFDDIGVWPELVTLPCGVQLAAYGRPGVYVRATNDPIAKKWDNRITVLEPEGDFINSCCNVSLLVTGKNTAAIAYSHFKWPDRDGVPRKTILFRTIEVIDEPAHA